MLQMGAKYHVNNAINYILVHTQPFYEPFYGTGPDYPGEPVAAR